MSRRGLRRCCVFVVCPEEVGVPDLRGHRVVGVGVHGCAGGGDQDVLAHVSSLGPAVAVQPVAVSLGSSGGMCPGDHDLAMLVLAGAGALRRFRGSLGRAHLYVGVFGPGAVRSVYSGPHAVPIDSVVLDAGIDELGGVGVLDARVFLVSAQTAGASFHPVPGCIVNGGPCDPDGPGVIELGCGDRGCVGVCRFLL